MHRVILLLGIVALAGAVDARPAPPAPVSAYFLDVAGAVEVQRGRAGPTKATLLFRLWPRDVVRVGTGGRAEILLRQSARRYALAAGSTVRVESEALRRLAGPAPELLPDLPFLRRMRTPAPPAPGVILGEISRGSGDAALGPRAPTPDGAVRQAPVTLRWAGPVEAEQLVLRIRRAARTLHEVELPPAAREFRVPDGLLRPGEWYSWSLTAIQGGRGGGKCGALLRVLAPEELADVEQAERHAVSARTANPESPSPSLLLAQVYQRYGLFDEAAAAYAAAQQLRPEDAGVRAALDELAARREK